MQPRSIGIPLPRGPLAALSGLQDEPAQDAGRAVVLLANGAGLPMDSPFQAAVAEGLARRGFPVLRFDYPYQERARAGGPRRAPDRAPVLEEAHAAAAARMRELFPARRLLLAGKSMGGRMASHLAAKGVACDGLVFLGFPLHAPRKPSSARAEHFAAIAQPALFLQGTRDDLCDLDLLRAALARWGGRATLAVFEDADHSFRVPRRSGRSDDAVREALLERCDAWERETWPS